MTTEMYTVYDKIAMQCKGIFHAVNQQDAIRTFRKAYKDNENREDFELMKLGDFNHDNGTGTMLEVPETIKMLWPGKTNGEKGKDE